MGVDVVLSGLFVVLCQQTWPSGRDAPVASQQPTESLIHDEVPGGGVGAIKWHDQLVAETLVRSLKVEVGDVFVQSTPERLFPEQDHAI